MYSIYTVRFQEPMRIDVGNAWGHSIEHRATGCGRFSLLYCVVTWSLDPEHLTNQVGAHGIDS